MIEPVTTKKYRLHVEGKIFGEGPERFRHTYECDKAPFNKEEARRIAGDFEQIDNMICEEVSVITTKRILTLR